jgi:hypothetical protein
MLHNQLVETILTTARRHLRQIFLEAGPGGGGRSRIAAKRLKLSIKCELLFCRNVRIKLPLMAMSHSSFIGKSCAKITNLGTS